jgi:(S)-sulfolactate dehydrogenase
VVSEDAVAAALTRGHLGGAALDVFETEPLTLAAAARFQHVPNLILTPHIAGPTQDSNARVSTIIADAVRRVLERKQ